MQISLKGVIMSQLKSFLLRNLRNNQAELAELVDNIPRDDGSDESAKWLEDFPLKEDICKDSLI
jgi:hypothetical protein